MQSRQRAGIEERIRQARELEAGGLHAMAEQGARDRFAQAGRARVLSHHTWAASMHKLDGIIDRCLALARRAGSGRADGTVDVGMRE